MLEMDVRLETYGLQNLLQRLEDRFGPRGKSLLLADIGEHMVQSVEANFEAEGRPVKWKPLSPKTIRAWLRKRRTWLGKKHTVTIGGGTLGLSEAGYKAYLGRKILQDTGTLLRSIHWRITGPYQVSIRPAPPASRYAATHQFGSARQNIPARPFLMIQQEDLDWIKNRLLEMLR